MIQARKELLERQSLEESYLIAGGGELASLVRPQVPRSDYLEAQGISFSRPRPGSVGRSRSTMCTTSSSRSETPPLSSNASLSTPSNRRTHARGPGGQGYRRRLSDVRRSYPPLMRPFKRRALVPLILVKLQRPRSPLQCTTPEPLRPYRRRFD